MAIETAQDAIGLRCVMKGYPGIVLRIKHVHQDLTSEEGCDDMRPSWANAMAPAACVCEVVSGTPPEAWGEPITPFGHFRVAAKDLYFEGDPCVLIDSSATNPPRGLFFSREKSMFERFTDRALKVMNLARQKAQHLNHLYIGTEHILLGLMEEDSGVAANVLRRLKVDPEKIRVEIKKIGQDSPIVVNTGQLPFTPRCKRMLELASEEAINLHHCYIGTEHLLLGVVRTDEGTGTGAAALKNLGLNLQSIHDGVMELLGVVVPGVTTPVSFDDYQEFTRTTAVYPGCDDQNFNSAAYCTFGLTGEAGEVAEKMKKRYRLGGPNAFLPRSVVDYNGKPETYEEFVEAMKKELGDVLWYVAGLSTELGLKLSDVAHGNITKLSSRKDRGVLKGKGDDR